MTRYLRPLITLIKRSRLDLRPGKGDTIAGQSAEGSALPPPLALEGEDGEHSAASHRNRISRFFDIHRLRQASVEEQMAALRQIRAERTEQPSAAAETDGEARRQGARFANKLKERFRIRTRAQSRERGNGGR
jgi:hypothetical protein